MGYFSNQTTGEETFKFNQRKQLRYLPFLLIRRNIWWSMVLLFLVFEIGLNLALLSWNYWKLIFYPFWWFLFFSLQSELQWWLGLFLSLIVDYLIGFPLGFSWLIVNFLDFSCYFLFGSWWHLNRVQQGIRIVFLATLLSVIVRLFFFLPLTSLLGFFLETVFLISYGLKRNAKFYR